MVSVQLIHLLLFLMRVSEIWYNLMMFRFDFSEQTWCAILFLQGFCCHTWFCNWGLDFCLSTSNAINNCCPIVISLIFTVVWPSQLQAVEHPWFKIPRREGKMDCWWVLGAKTCCRPWCLMVPGCVPGIYMNSGRQRKLRKKRSAQVSLWPTLII